MKLNLEPKRVIPPVVFGLVAVAYLVEAFTFSDPTSAQAPILYGFVLLGLSVLAGVLALRPQSLEKEHSVRPHSHRGDGPVNWKRVSAVFLLTASLIVLVFLLGFYLALFIFISMFLWRVSGISLWKAVLVGFIAWVLTWLIFGWFLNLEVYQGYLGLPLGF